MRLPVVRRVFVCDNCGRVQTYARQGKPGGITVAEAARIGWRQRGLCTLCPLCPDLATHRHEAA